MNAQSHLQSFGWLGPGHALNSHVHNSKRPGRGGLGLTKPLLLAHKKDNSGLGRKAANLQPDGGEWWLKGFESTLKGINGDASAREQIKRTPREEKHGGLYSFFVSGGRMGGTLEINAHSETSTVVLEKKSKKRKSVAISTDTSPTVPTNVRPPADSVPSTDDPVSDFQSAVSYLSARDPARRPKYKSKKHDREPEEQFSVATAYFSARNQDDEKRKKDRRAKMRGRTSDGNLITLYANGESEGRQNEETASRKKTKKEKSEDQGEANGPSHVANDTEARTYRKWAELVNGTKHHEGGNAVADSSVSDPEDREARAVEKAARRARKEERRRRRAEKEVRASTLEVGLGNGVPIANPVSVEEGHSSKKKKKTKRRSGE